MHNRGQQIRKSFDNSLLFFIISRCNKFKRSILMVHTFYHKISLDPKTKNAEKLEKFDWNAPMQLLSLDTTWRIKGGNINKEHKYSFNLMYFEHRKLSMLRKKCKKKLYGLCTFICRLIFIFQAQRERKSNGGFFSPLPLPTPFSSEKLKMLNVFLTFLED